MQKLTQEQLEAIRKRAEAASAGPWYIDGVLDVHSSRGDEIAAVWDGDADIEFISHSREDIPALLAEVERLQNREVSLEMALYGKECEVRRVQEQLDRIETRVVEAIRND